MEASVPLQPERLWNRNFTLLWLGQTISQLGNPAFNIGAMYWMMEKTGSASLMGLLLTASAIPSILLTPVGGTFADRHSRVRIMIWSDLISGIAVLSFATAIWLRPDDKGLIIPLLYVVAMVLGLVRAFFNPAEGAIIPDLVPKEKLQAANSLNHLSVQVSAISGQGVGGFLYSFLGPVFLFCIDGISYLVAGLCTLFIPRDVRAPRPAATTEARGFRQFLTETAEGFRYVWSHKGQRDFLFAASLTNFLSMPGFVLFPFYVERYLKAGPEWYGFLMAGVSVGVVLGFVAAGVLRLSNAARGKVILAAMVLYPVFFGSLAIWREPAAALTAIVLGGITTGLINIYLMTLMQASTPAELRGRVMGFIGLLAGGLMPIGMALGGVVGDLTDKNVPLVLGVCAALALLTVFVFALRRDGREFLAS